MDFRKTYAGPGVRFDGRAGSDAFAQLGRDTHQERDDRARQDSSGGKGVNRPTQSSLAKGAADNRTFRNSFSARTSGRYSALSQSVDLGPALRSSGHAPGSSIPRQPGLHQQPAPPPPTAAAAAHAVQLKLQDLIDAGQQREALLQEQKRHLEASLHSTNVRCAELARGLQQTSSALDAERAAADRLRCERDEHVAELDRARSQAAELQASGSIALTTSEVCRAALSTAFKGTVSAIGSAHEELESALESQKQQERELEAQQMRIEELEEVAHTRKVQLEEARAMRWKLSEEMEELAGQLQAREDDLNALVVLLAVPGAAESGPSYDDAKTRAKGLTGRVQELEQQLSSQGVDMANLQGRVADYQAQMLRLEERLRGGSSGRSSPGSAAGQMDLEAQVTELADEREQLEGDNLQLAAENEQLRRDNAGLSERLREALLTAAAVTAASDRNASAVAEVLSLQQQMDVVAAQAHDWRHQVDEARAQAYQAQLRADDASKLLQDAAAQAEGARAQVEEIRSSQEAARVEAVRQELEVLRAQAKAAESEIAAARAQAEAARGQLEALREQARCEVEEARAQADKVHEVSAEAALLRSRVGELTEQLMADRRASREALEQLTAMHANEDALLQRILAGEAERQQLLRQIDEGNSVLAGMRRRLDEMAQQAGEVAELRAHVASLTAEAERQAEMAAAAAARLVPLEGELQELRAALRASAERAGQDARLTERREQQLAALRQQALDVEEQQAAAEAEMRVLKAQVSVNDRLRALVDDLQSRLTRATLAKPGVDAFAHVSGGGASSTTATTTTAPDAGHSGGGAPLAHDCHEGGGLLASHTHAARQSMVAGWLGAGGPYTTDRVQADSLLESYNAIPEDEPEDAYDRSYDRRPGGRVRPLRFLFGLAVKGTLVAGGMALGLALGNPQAFQALTGSSGGTGGGSARPAAGQMVVVEGITLPAQA